MSRINDLPLALRQSLIDRNAIKVISGLSNFDSSLVEKISRSASLGGADFIDVACDPLLVKLAIDVSDLPVCVSSVEPELFLPAVDSGATMIEIGNFDSFYPQGRFFDADEVLKLTCRTREILPHTFLSVTVPHTLSIDRQSQLALDLVKAGADMIQTEGGVSSKALHAGSLGLIEKASQTLAATYTISKALIDAGCEVPVISASGLSEVTVSMAIAAGASAVGVGSLINKLNDELAMIATVKRLRKSLFALHKVDYTV